jgi:HNH endonuclease/AP2 domain
MKPTDIESGITAEHLRSIIHYDSETGVFTWLRPNPEWKAGRAGDRAGCFHKSSGYRAIKINSRAYREHRLAWFYVHGEWPKDELDHVNCDKADNRLSNLREASRHQNLANAPAWGKNLKGADHLPSGRWRAKMCVKYKQITIGIYDTEQEAHDAYLNAVKNLYGDFARSA